VPIKTHTFNGTSYDLHIGACDGSCDPPKRVCDPSMFINLDPDKSLRFLETVIHESLHACHYSKSEEHVTRSARDIARLLWRLGYRLDI
jgi:hypothetical protein